MVSPMGAKMGRDRVDLEVAVWVLAKYAVWLLYRFDEHTSASVAHCVER